MDSEILGARAVELAERHQAVPELGIDPWDVPEYCPFHGDVPCACFEIEE